MNLKESFQYQNLLSSFTDNAVALLVNPKNITKVTQIHRKSKASKELEDEPLDLAEERTAPCTADELIGFLQYLTEERERLTDSITEAKRSSEFDYDGEIAKNKNRQRIAKLLASLGNTKPSKITKRGTGYKFNNEGVQMPFNYDIEETSEIDFDVDAVKTLSREMTNQSNNISTELDRLVINVEVDYKPLFCVGDTFEDALATYLKS